MLYRTENQLFTTFSNFKHGYIRSFIGPPIFFTGPPTFSSVKDRGLTSFAESDIYIYLYIYRYIHACCCSRPVLSGVV